MRSYLWVSAMLFAAVALAHALRLAFGWSAQLAGWTVPLWLSGLGVLVPGALCAWAIVLLARQTP